MFSTSVVPHCVQVIDNFGEDSGKMPTVAGSWCESAYLPAMLQTWFAFLYSCSLLSESFSSFALMVKIMPRHEYLSTCLVSL